jgi:hypothetical protein
MNKQILLTTNYVEDIKNFINIVGDIHLASEILEIGKKTLEKYITEKNVSIPIHIWENKIRPTIKLSTKDIYKVLIERIKQLSDDNKYYKNEYFKRSLESGEIIRNTNKLISNFDEIVLSPLMCYMHINDYDHEKLKELENALFEIAKNKEYNKYKLVHTMEYFASIYELFRPNTIDQRSHYWGTVGIIDEIYIVLFCYLDTEPIIRFSKAFPSFEDAYHLYKKKEYEQIDWEALKKDVEIVRDAIIRTINEESIKLFSLIGSAKPYRLEYYITNYIKYYLPNINGEDIKIKENSIISISGTDIYVKNEYSFFSEICKLKEK